VKLLHLQARQLAPYAEGLRALESSIRYPVGDGEDHFTIDHGPDYHPFFSEMGEAHFMVGVDGDEVFASLAGVFRTACLGERHIQTAYLGDFKLAPSHRGRGLGRRMGTKCLRLLWDQPELRRWRIAYGAAMRGDRGDVTRTLRGLHPGRLMRPLAEQAMYFEAPSRLRSLGDGPPTPPGGLDLGGTQAPGPLFVSTEGRKNLRLESTGQHWPLMHLPRAPQHWTSLGSMLAEAAHTLPGDSVACFAVDRRLDGHIRWLHSVGIEAGATCTLYALTRPGTLPRGLPWVHLATSEI
jgi:hypothetical protein